MTRNRPRSRGICSRIRSRRRTTGRGRSRRQARCRTTMMMTMMPSSPFGRSIRREWTRSIGRWPMRSCGMMACCIFVGTKKYLPAPPSLSLPPSSSSLLLFAFAFFRPTTDEMDVRPPPPLLEIEPRRSPSDTMGRNDSTYLPPTLRILFLMTFFIMVCIILSVCSTLSQNEKKKKWS
jgi:hypothetical protein